MTQVLASKTWPTVELGEVVELKYGKSLPKSSRSGSGYPVYGSNGEVGRHEIALTTGVTIVVGRKGSHGAVNFSASACWPIDTTYFVDETCTSADLGWLKYRLTGLRLDEMNKAAAVPGLNREDAYRQKLLLPPIEEQRRIAAILDAADALRAKRRQALAKLDTLTQAIFIDMFGDPIQPGREGLTTMSKLVEFVGGGTPSKSQAHFFDGDICWATSKDMKSDLLTDTQDHITEEAISKSSTKLVEPGAVLVVVKSKILAHTLPVAIATVPTCFGQDLKALIPGSDVNSAFIASALRAAEPWLLSRTRGANTEGLTLDELRRLPVPIAPPETIADFEKVSASVEAQRAEQKRAVRLCDNFFASLQQRAFRGDL